MLSTNSLICCVFAFSYLYQLNSATQQQFWHARPHGNQFSTQNGYNQRHRYQVNPDNHYQWNQANRFQPPVHPTRSNNWQDLTYHNRYNSRDAPAPTNNHAYQSYYVRPALHTNAHQPPSFATNRPRTYQGGRFEPNCFITYPHRLIINLNAFERTTGSTLQSCKQRCLDSIRDLGIICKSLVFDHHAYNCDLYSRNGRTPPAVLHSVYGYDYYEKLESCSSISPAPSTNSSVISSSTRELATTAPMTTTRRPMARSCPMGEAPVMLRAQDYRMVGLEGELLFNVDEIQCREACRLNRNPNGRTIICHSANYDTQINQCTLSSLPVSNELVSFTGNTYFEKVCINDDISIRCPEHLQYFPQMQLIGFAQEVVPARTTAECIEKCLDSLNLYNSDCKSAMHFYSDLNDPTNCVLNFDDHLADPDFFIPVRLEEELITYFTIGQCSRRQKQQPRRGSNPRSSEIIFVNNHFSPNQFMRRPPRPRTTAKPVTQTLPLKNYTKQSKLLDFLKRHRPIPEIWSKPKSTSRSMYDGWMQGQSKYRTFFGNQLFI